MKILFKNKTKYTTNAYNQFLNFHQSKFGFSYDTYTIIILILLVVCMFLQIKYRYWYLAIIFFLVIVGFIYYRFFYPVKEVSNEVHSEKFEKEKEFTFVFFDNSFEIRDKIYREKSYYNKLKHVYETKDFFYLYTDKNHAYILDKSGFINCTSTDFRNIIKKKCFFKYKYLDKSSFARPFLYFLIFFTLI